MAALGVLLGAAVLLLAALRWGSAGARVAEAGPVRADGPAPSAVDRGQGEAEGEAEGLAALTVSGGSPGDGAQSNAGREAAEAPAESAGSSLDLSALAPIEALLRDENSQAPLANVTCFVTDANSIVVEGTTDANGVLRTDDLALVGPVTLQYISPRASYYLARGNSLEDLALGLVDDDGRASKKIYRLPVTRRLRHSGEPGERDVWDVYADPIVGLCFSGVESPFSLTVSLVSADGSARRAQPSRMHESGVAAPAWAESSPAAYVLTLETPKLSFRSRDWSPVRAARSIPGRLLRAVAITEHEAFVAEVDAASLPAFKEAPLEVKFEPFEETDPAALRSRYDPLTVGPLSRFLERRRRSQEVKALGVARIAGTVKSQSGTFQGRVRVQAGPLEIPAFGDVPFPMAETEVEWRPAKGGGFEGSFALEGLGAARYRVTLTPQDGVLMNQARHEVAAPHFFDSGALIVRDAVVRYPLCLRVSGPGNEPVYGYTAELTAQLEGRKQQGTAMGPIAPPDELSAFAREEDARRLPVIKLPLKLPRDTSFSVKLTAPGFQEVILSEAHFHFDGERLVAAPTMGPD